VFHTKKFLNCVLCKNGTNKWCYVQFPRIEPPKMHMNMGPTGAEQIKNEQNIFRGIAKQLIWLTRQLCHLLLRSTHCPLNDGEQLRRSASRGSAVRGRARARGVAGHTTMLDLGHCLARWHQRGYEDARLVAYPHGLAREVVSPWSWPAARQGLAREAVDDGVYGLSCISNSPCIMCLRRKNSSFARERSKLMLQ
jgi:hypothetical protein